ncbi:hypothetical protein PITCH_A240032 [uncultured Desulfobacterium sp.]|uniref:Uncharacterized protein n=1 Tax=uncultured Desulfobacterium sp. TaxID=201089 RepID=A0A445MYZ7_9BACT|nr:hypothetical protein PITCH_A240032 [uncultured Desulfobacterium sp.]
MEIIIGQNIPVQNEQTGVVAPLKAVRRPLRRDQRKNKYDRREAVRDGIIVSLSSREDRRKSNGRRKTDFHAWA